MNGSDDGTDSDGNLKGFYAYKNTFDEGSVWLEVPKQGKTAIIQAVELLESSSEPSNIR